MKAGVKRFALLTVVMMLLFSCGSLSYKDKENDNAENINEINVNTNNHSDKNNDTTNVNTTNRPMIHGSSIDASFINDIERARIAAGDNGNICIANGETLYILDSEGNEINKIVNDEDFGYNSLTTGEDVFFASTNRRKLEEYSFDGTLERKYNFLMGKQYSGCGIDKILHINDKIYVLYHHMDNYTDKHLAEYDLTNETLKEIDITDVRDIIKYKEDIKKGGH